MIKWAGFGKLLKQSFFILLISCFILLGGSFVSAGLIENQLNQLPSDNNSNYKISFLNKGQVLTNYLGTAKSVLALDSNVIFWWSKNGKPYFYSPKYQGYFNSFSSCDELTGGSTIPTNCSEISFTTGSLDIFRNFFSKVAIGDYSYYRYSPYYNAGVNCTSRNFGIEVCFSSHEIGNTLCFRRSECSNGCQNGYYFCQEWCGNWGGCGGGLVDSLGLTDLDFGNISYNLIGPAPGQVGYNGNYDASEGNTEINIDNSLSGDYNYISCTYGEIISELELAGFNKYMCYGGIDNYDLYDSSLSYNPIPGSGLRLSQILANAISQGAWSSPQDWFNFWDGLYSDRYNNNYNAMWESYPAVYHTWFDLYYQYGRKLNKNFDYVREYCAMTVDINVNPDTIYNGTYFVGVCDTINDKRIYGSNNVGSGKTAVGTNWNGVGDLSGVVVSNDPLKFIQDFFNLSKENVPTRYDFGLGTLPVYIITFMCALILFRFLRH